MPGGLFTLYLPCAIDYCVYQYRFLTFINSHFKLTQHQVVLCAD
jgi:hypothetical protein